jgi:hypothetical protein
MSTDLKALAQGALAQELEGLRDAVRELAALLSEQELWAKPIEPGNSVGHLVLHLAGNLNHFVEALARLDDAVATFRRVVEGLSAEQLAAPHPEARLGVVFLALVHLVSHFALHRGQMSYIARLVKRGDRA